MSIAVTGTFGFFIFLTVMLAESKDRADLLKNIRDVRYPAQENCWPRTMDWKTLPAPKHCDFPWENLYCSLS